MHYFVIASVFIFLLMTLFLAGFQYVIGALFLVGLPVVPVLLLANLLLGIYVTLSAWFKLVCYALRQGYCQKMVRFTIAPK